MTSKTQLVLLLGLIASSAQAQDRVGHYDLIAPEGSGELSLESGTATYVLPTSHGAAGTILSEDGDGDLAWISTFPLDDSTEVASAADYISLNVEPDIDSLTSTYFGIKIAPTVVGDGSGSAKGISVDMTGVSAVGDGNTKAIDAIGDVAISGVVTASKSFEPVDGGGNPSALHSIGTVFQPIADTANVDKMAFSPSMNIHVDDDVEITSGSFEVGLTGLGMLNFFQMDTGSDLDFSNGSFVAMIPTSGAGHVGTMTAYRAIGAALGGTVVVDNMIGFKFDLPAGPFGTDSWGFYDEGAEYNWLKNSLKIGGTAGSTDRAGAGKVFEIESPVDKTGIYVSASNNNDETSLDGAAFFADTAVADSASHSAAVYAVSSINPDGFFDGINPANSYSAGLYVEAVAGSVVPAAVIAQELGSTGPALRLVNGVNFDFNTIDISAPARVAGGSGAYAITLPEGQGAASSVMMNDGAGALAWRTVSRQVAAPSTASDSCVAGQTSYDASFFYVCVATNTWKRSAIITW